MEANSRRTSSGTVLVGEARIVIQASAEGVLSVRLKGNHMGLLARPLVPVVSTRGKVGVEAEEVLEEAVAYVVSYLSGVETGPRVRCDLSGLPEFSRIVLDRVSGIPRGELRTYGEIASSVGAPTAARAVGSVLRRNPVPLLIPCHRVIKSDGTVGGFAPGPEWKRALMAIDDERG